MKEKSALELAQEHSVISEEAKPSWDEQRLLVFLGNKQQCHKCFRGIVPGSYAIKFYGMFYHYPGCPQVKRKKEKQDNGR